MYISKRLIRSYYEMNGTFKGIEDEPVMKGIDLTESVLYQAIGYTDKSSYEEELNILHGNRTNVNKIDESLRVISEYEKPTIENIEYVRLVSEYFRNCKSLDVAFGQEIVNFGDLLRKASYEASVSKISSFINSSEFNKCLKVASPAWQKCDIENPTITLGVLYTSDTVSVKERNKIALHAAMNTAYHILDIPLPIRANIITLVDKDIVTLAEKAPNSYKQLIRFSIKFRLTIKELLELCTVNYIDTIEQVKKFGCSITPFTRNSVKIYGKDSSINDFIVVSNETFTLLYERDLIKTLTWSNGIAYVTTTRKMELHSLLGKNPGRDLR